MKRIIPLLLALSMVVCLFAVPALADTQDTVGEARYLFAEPSSWLSIITESGQPYLFVFDFACEESTLLEVFTEDYNGGTKFTFNVNFVSNALPVYPLRHHKIYCFTGSTVNTITLSEMSSRYLQGTFSFSSPLSTYAFNNSNELLNLSPYIYTNRHAVYFEGAVDFATYLDSISAKIDTSNGLLDVIRNWLQNIWTEVSFLEMIYDRIGLFWDTVTTGFQNVGVWFTSLGNKISDGFDSVVSWFSTFYNKAVTSWQGILDKLDALIEGTGAAADKLEQDAADLSQAGSDLSGDVGQIGDFEDQQFEILDDNFDDISSGSDITMLGTTLSWILIYTNHVVEAVPSNYRAYWSVPFFFGIFFLICQHAPGVTQVGRYVEYKSKPKRPIGFAPSKK